MGNVFQSSTNKVQDATQRQHDRKMFIRELICWDFLSRDVVLFSDVDEAWFEYLQNPDAFLTEARNKAGVDDVSGVALTLLSQTPYKSLVLYETQDLSSRDAVAGPFVDPIDLLVGIRVFSTEPCVVKIYCEELFLGGYTTGSEGDDHVIRFQRVIPYMMLNIILKNPIRIVFPLEHDCVYRLVYATLQADVRRALSRQMMLI
jgi:hypothetical protein